MSDLSWKQSRRFNKLSWCMAPILLAAVLLAGGITFFAAHAASPLDGRYEFRGVTLSGAEKNLYITGILELHVSGTTVTGGICGISLAASHCTLIESGTTPDNVHVSFTIHTIAGHAPITVTGIFQSGLGSNGGFTGTFSSTSGAGVSSGRWEARRQGSIPSATGVWNIYGLVTKGPSKGTTFHAVLSLVQQPNNQLTGSYCPSHGTCQNVTGGNHQGYLYLYIFVGTPPSLELRGTFTADHRANGQFQVPGPGGTLIEEGYWLGH